MRGETYRPVWHSWVPLAIALAVSAVMAGCAHAPSSGHAIHGSLSTTTSRPVLAWRAVTLPPGIELASFTHQPGGATFAISPADGRMAWLCAPSTPDTFAIWATTDAGATWRQVGSLAPGAPMPPSCTLLADELDPGTISASISWGAGADGTLRAASWLSNDGGATWHAMPGDFQVIEIATRAGATYAILHGTDPASAPIESVIAISTDGLRTWHVAAPSGFAAGDSIVQFWLSPTSRELLAASTSNTLWHSTDAGVTWARVTTAMQIRLGAWIASPPHWLLCGFTQTPPQISCTADLGANWTAHPELINTYTCATCGKWGASSGGTDHCVTGAIAPDGALLFACTPSGSVPDSTHFALYRLAPGSSTWAMLGTAPGPWLTLPAAGPLWCWNAQSGTLATTSMPEL